MEGLLIMEEYKDIIEISFEYRQMKFVVYDEFYRLREYKSGFWVEFGAPGEKPKLLVLESLDRDLMGSDVFIPPHKVDYITYLKVDDNTANDLLNLNGD
jgi:hypothetical protein